VPRTSNRQLGSIRKTVTSCALLSTGRPYRLMQVMVSISECSLLLVGLLGGKLICTENLVDRQSKKMHQQQMANRLLRPWVNAHHISYPKGVSRWRSTPNSCQPLRRIRLGKVSLKLCKIQSSAIIVHWTPCCRTRYLCFTLRLHSSQQQFSVPSRALQ
jgi:hypothetical protein